MQLPITIRLRRSFVLGAGLAITQLLAVIALVLPLWPTPAKVLLLSGLAVSAALCWRSWSPEINRLCLFGDGRLECGLACGEEGLVEATLLPGATVHPWLTVVRLQLGGRRRVLVLLPDSMKAADFRRLRVWLRWRAGFSVPDVAA